MNQKKVCVENNHGGYSCGLRSESCRREILNTWTITRSGMTISGTLQMGHDMIKAARKNEEAARMSSGEVWPRRR